MLTTPLRSEKRPPIAANVSGVAKRSVAARSADHVITTSRFPTFARVAIAPPISPSSTIETPVQPRRVCPGRQETTPAPTPGRPITIGTGGGGPSRPGRPARGNGLRPPAAQLQPGTPEVDDQEVGADEEHDEPLDDQRQVPGELRLEDGRIEVPRRGAVQERAEEQRAEEDADGRVPPQQRDGNADERDLRRDLDARQIDAKEPAEHVDAAGEPGEGAGDRHRREVAPPHADPAVARRLRVEADRAHLVAERRPVQHDPEHDQRGERDEEADVQCLQDRIAPEDVELRACRHLLRHGHGLLRRILERPLEADEIAPDPERDPVQHDRRDHLVRANGRLQDPGDPRPERARERAGNHAEDDVRDVRHVRRGDSDLGADDHPDDVLTLDADVEEAAAEGEGDGEAAEDQRRRDDQRLLEVEAGAEALPAGIRPLDPREEPVQAGAIEDRAVGVERVLPGREEDDESADEERERRGQQRRDDPAGPLVEGQPRGDARNRLQVGRRPRLGRWRGVAHDAAAACWTVPPGIAMPSCSSVTSGPYSATIRPSYRTRMRSASESTSSISSEIRSTARPSSRSSTSRRWTNSIAPTSRPRVGCAAISTLGSRVTSRATTTFCWFPPDSADARVSGPPPRTSNSRSRRRAQLMIRRGHNQPKRENGCSSKSCKARFSARENSSTRPRRWRSSGMW